MPPEAEKTETIPEVLADILSLVAGVMIPAEVIATWTTQEREQAAKWAAAEHLHASDNDVRRIPQPLFVARAADICASPAMAQIAVESWVMAKEKLESSGAACAEDLLEDTEPLVQAAQDAITGLLVLLKSQPQEDRRLRWQEIALENLAKHPEGLRAAELMALSGRHGPSSREVLHAWLQEGEASGTLEHAGFRTWRLKKDPTA